MKKRIFIGVLAAAIIGLLAYFGVSEKKNTEYSAQQNINAPIEIPDVGIFPIQEITDTEKPVIALFYADWCTYCRRFMPEYGKIAKKYREKYNFAVINCDFQENEEYVKNFHIIGFPSLFIIDNKLGYRFALNPATVADNSIFKDELDNYLKFRNGILEKISQ